MKTLKALYFTALLPPEEIRQEVLQIKQGINERFGVKHALKLPAHITLVPPFWLETAREKELFKVLSAATKEIDPFKVDLKDFGRFGQSVIFIKVMNPEPVKMVHREILSKTESLLGGSEEHAIHPHMTIATRDLRKEMFHKVWNSFQHSNYYNTFYVNSLFLFRHNGQSWEIIRELNFQRN